MKKSAMIVKLLAILFFFPCAGFGATINVPADYATIQGAIDVAATGDLILVQAGTYVDNIYLLGKEITLQSADGEDYTVIDGGGAGPVVTCMSGETASTSIEGFTLTNGTGYGGSFGGGVICYSSSPTITRCTITANTAGAGAGVCLLDSSSMISRCTISGNTASVYGGGSRASGVQRPSSTAPFRAIQPAEPAE